ncbi:MAG: DUF1905 domain-containing protein, partial [Bacteroidota bacterium]
MPFKEFKGKQRLRQLEKRKGGYYYLEIVSSIVDQLRKKRATRLVCTLESEVRYRCGLNHLGNGNFFVIVASRHLEKIGKSLGDEVTYEFMEDPDQLGVEVPEVLVAYLAQDEDSKKIYEGLTDGKKRSLIYAILKISDFDNKVRQ